MQTITLNLYNVDELEGKAKEKARDWWRYSGELAWSDESLESIKAFSGHFGVTLKDYSVGPNAPLEFSTNAEKNHFRGVKLKDFDRDHMPTGYCLDCSLWMTFYDIFKKTGDPKAAFDAAIHAGFKDWRADMESQLEDEHIDEHLIANEYQFTENGSFYK
jgi:hypothetical protein